MPYPQFARDWIAPARAWRRLTIVAIVVVVGLLLVLYAFEQRQTSLVNLNYRLVSQAHLRSRAALREIQDLANDARFMANCPPVLGELRATMNHGTDPLDQSTGAQWQGRMARIFTSFAMTHPDVVDVRFVTFAADAIPGHVTRNARGVAPWQSDALSPEDMNALRQEIRGLRGNQVYIADPQLRREAGKVLQPAQPVLQVATPVFSPDGALFGAVLITEDAEPLLQGLRTNLPEGFRVYLCNYHGDYLLGPEDGRVFGFDSGRRWRWDDDFRSREDFVASRVGLHSYVMQGQVVHAMDAHIPLAEGSHPRFLELHVIAPDTMIEAAMWREVGLVGGAVLGALAALGLVFYLYGRQQREVRAAIAHLAAIVESSNDAIIGESFSGLITSWNRSAELMFGYTAGYVIGRPGAPVCGEVAKAAGSEALARVRQGNTLANLRVTLHRSGGEAFEASVTIAPVRSASGKVVGIAKTVRDITEQVVADHAIRQLNESLEGQVKERTRQLESTLALQRAVVSDAGLAVIATDAQGVITLFNPAAERMLGYMAEEMVGKLTPAAFHDPEEVVARAMAFSAELGEPVEAGFGTFVIKSLRGLPNEHEWTYVRRDGSRLPVLLTVTALRDGNGALLGFVGMALDISQQHKDRQNLMLLSHHLSKAAEVAELGIWSWHLDEADGDMEWNDRMYEIYGIAPDMRGMYMPVSIWSTTIHPDDIELVHAKIAEVARGEYSNFMMGFRIIRPDGGERFIQAAAVMERDVDGNPSRLLGINRDVTLQHSQETTLREATLAAEAANQAKSDFLANMSHEIRTPMNAVLGVTRLLESTELNGEQRKYLEMLRGAGQSLLAIINDILDFSKIEAGKMELMRREYALDEVLQSVAGTMAISAGDKDLELAIMIDPDVPTVLIGDSMRLQQVLVNLVGNAIKFTPRGEVVLTVQRDAGSVSGERLRFAVRDTGIGISPEQKARLFSVFSQADTSTTRRFGGTGLGLAISKRLVEQMGGEIGVDSEPGAGSTFWFTLAVETPAEQPVRDQTPAGGALTVLLADDNRSSRGYLQRQMEAWGWRVVATDSGRAALAELRDSRSRGLRFDLVMLDWLMPELDGVAVLEEMARAGLRLPTVLMCNAGVRQRLETLPQRSLMHAVLLKPITSSSLFDATQEAQASFAGEVAVAPTALHNDEVLAGVRILLVEDNELNQVVAQGLLEQFGAEVDLAGNGQIAVDTLTAGAHRYQLVLMDVQMPVMDGFEASRRIREDLKLTLPILAMSAGVFSSERERCMKSGMNDFIAKPIDVAEMMAVITRHVGARTEVAEPERRYGDVLPVDDLLRNFPNNARYRNALRGTLSRLAAEEKTIAEQVSDLLAAGDADAARGLLHKVRGLIGTLGGKQFAEVALGVEKALHEGQPEQALALMPGLAVESEAVRTAARAWLEDELFAELPE